MIPKYSNQKHVKLRNQKAGSSWVHVRPCETEQPDTCQAQKPEPTIAICDTTTVGCWRRGVALTLFFENNRSNLWFQIFAVPSNPLEPSPVLTYPKP
eukprot:2653146-Rhodomonas_salina.2